jgi:hypothetical protein
MVHVRQLHSPMVTLNHNEIIDGTVCLVWQESQNGSNQFALHSAPFQPRRISGSTGAGEIAMNANYQLFATKDSSRPWTLWIWDILSTRPLAIVNFRERIKQLIWHPIAPHILLILTSHKEPLLYVWHVNKQQLLILRGLTVSADAGIVDCEVNWLGGRCHGFPLLFISSPYHYDAGILDAEQDGVVFQSLLRQELPD